MTDLRPSPGPAPEHRRRTPLFELLALFRVDFPDRPASPRAFNWCLATAVSLVGSLGLDMAIVAIGKALFPGLSGYPHFQFGDYAKLTVIGVVIACVAWPVTVFISSEPRWLFFRMAIAVTLVLWLPDVWILIHGQPGRAVAVLMVMHLVIALVTYNALVRLAPPSRRPSGRPLYSTGRRLD